MRERFGILNDLTPEEEAGAVLQVQWAIDAAQSS
jgi:hypothetical protein